VFAAAGSKRPPEVCKQRLEFAQAHGHDVVILDTAGRLHIDEPLMQELQECTPAPRPHGVLLVCDAMLGQDAVNSAKEFHARLPLHGLILTKVDGDSRGGAALSIVKVTGRPILFAGVGEKPDDLEPFDPSRMAGRILGMGDVVGLVEKAQSVIDEREAEKAARKLQKGQFNFEDFLAQMNMIRKLGPLKKVLGMLPGVGAAMKDVDFDDKHMKRLEAMILSMTPRERQKPDLIDLPRRRRIAAGSGNQLDAVNGLIKQFKTMQDLMKKLGKGGGMPPDLEGSWAAVAWAACRGRGASLGCRAVAAASPVAAGAGSRASRGAVAADPGLRRRICARKSAGNRGGHLLCFSPLSPAPRRTETVSLGSHASSQTLWTSEPPDLPRGGHRSALPPRRPHHRGPRLLPAADAAGPGAVQAQHRACAVLALGRRQAVADGRGHDRAFGPDGADAEAARAPEEQGQARAVDAAEEEGAQAQGATSRCEGCPRCRRQEEVRRRAVQAQPCCAAAARSVFSLTIV
jgi:hypothetical protein